eukprot:TRINITY_DN1282_c0_g1_i4.p1 TRINITY_DN1282_c0_g1~~TRINITY_DN1282_c0_g1_i4.p1  ORF type:complete len:495 (+),score=149.13 TRINITY_DN1282_c0_g1_i4:186-1487(+)
MSKEESKVEQILDAAQELQKLREENTQLKQQIHNLRSNVASTSSNSSSKSKSDNKSNNNNNNNKEGKDEKDSFLSIIVFGASGDLATKKTFPALFKLFSRDLLPKNVQIVGYARSNMSESDFHTHITKHVKGSPEHISAFKKVSFYFQGKYDKPEDFSSLSSKLEENEKKNSNSSANRVFYLAVPPFVFTATAQNVKKNCFSSSGYNRIVVEKPFGRDLESARELLNDLDQLYTEDQLYRIDHYLGKEMVQNLMVLRFANTIYEPVWNRHHIKSVLITFKEDFGMQGRGEYFDKYGIIRDVMQNHLTQMMALIGMEPPVSLNAEDVRTEKAKLLRAVAPLDIKDLVIGQYGEPINKDNNKDSTNNSSNDSKKDESKKDESKKRRIKKRRIKKRRIKKRGIKKTGYKKRATLCRRSNSRKRHNNSNLCSSSLTH